MPGSRTQTTEPAKVDTQGRTIIPKAAREALGIKGEKAYVVYEMDGETVRIRRVRWASD